MAKQRHPLTLGFLRGFDAAARHGSFTHAAEELHLTQSALSRQVKALEEELGAPLFQRVRHGLRLTPAGETLRRTVDDVLRQLAQAVAAIGVTERSNRLTISTTVPFAALWLVPRLPQFRRTHPKVEVFVSADNRVVDLDRGAVDLAVRYTSEEHAPERAPRLFGERVVPVVSPRVLRGAGRALRRPQDLVHHVLLHFEEPLGRVPWVDWSIWLASAGVPDLVPAGQLRFSQYDQLLQAALDGQGVALGRSPLIDHFLAAGKLVTPFPKRYDAPRAYFVLTAPHAATRPEARAFVDWMVAEAAREPPGPLSAGVQRTSAKEAPRRGSAKHRTRAARSERSIARPDG